MSALDTSAHTSSDLTGSYAYTDLKQVYYGPGIVETALPTLLQKIGAKKALIVTGKSLHDKVSSSSSHKAELTSEFDRLTYSTDRRNQADRSYPP